MSDTGPNVVVVCCDDLGYGDLSCYGAEYETPNVDRLADEGVRFADCHSNAPVCSPSRAALLTGRYPGNAGVPGNVGDVRGNPSHDANTGLPPGQRTVAEDLSEAGYDTACIGKWHLGMRAADGPNANGFDHFFGFRSGCVDYYSHLFIWKQGQGVEAYHDLWEDGEEVWENGEYLTEEITDRAVEYVEDHAGDDEDPFFLYVPYNAPHYPMHAPDEYFERFPDLEGDRLVQAAMVAGVDDGVGAVLDALERTGQREDTVVVFTSDHGPSRERRNHLDGDEGPYFGGETGGARGHKFSLFEGGIRVPGIVSYPGEVPAGEVREQLVVGMDVAPTLLELCGVDSAVDHDGESLVGVLRGNADGPHVDERVFWSAGEQLAVREGDWKLCLDVTADVTDDVDEVDRHLANLAEDPGERTDLSDERPDLTADLAAAAREWRAELERA
ncbi:MAG: sulfatase [Halobacteriaceae archaeon]